MRSKKKEEGRRKKKNKKTGNLSSFAGNERGAWLGRVEYFRTPAPAGVLFLGERDAAWNAREKNLSYTVQKSD